MPRSIAARRRNRQRSCVGKVRYPSELLAKSKVAKLKENREGKELVAYACQFCKGWHLGGRPRPNGNKSAEWRRRKKKLNRENRKARAASEEKERTS